MSWAWRMRTESNIKVTLWFFGSICPLIVTIVPAMSVEGVRVTVPVWVLAEVVVAEVPFGVKAGRTKA